jgi:hypothetical protein
MERRHPARRTRRRAPNLNNLDSTGNTNIENAQGPLSGPWVFPAQPHPVSSSSKEERQYHVRLLGAGFKPAPTVISIKLSL